MPLIAGTAYVGSWVNYNRGRILGATLTLPARYGAILSNILVLLITLDGVHFWGLCCFILHRLRTTSRAKDGLHYQQQAILRSRMPSNDALWRFLSIGWAWRSHTKASFRRSSTLAFVAIVNVVVFVTASIFSSHLTSSDSEILARGKCGFLKGINQTTEVLAQNDRNVSDVLYASAYTSYREESAYARACYGGELGRSNPACNVFSLPFIPSNRTLDAPCPFAERACSAPAVSFDTGYVSSDAHLGINSRPGDRIQYRRTLTCAPIATELYSTNWTTEKMPGLEQRFNLLIPDDEYKYLSFGSSGPLGNQSVSFTYVYSKARLSVQDRPYELDGGTYYPQNLENSRFIPIPDFNRSDADTTMMLLSNKALYTGPVNDSWFKATKSVNTSIGLSDVYFPDEPVSVIGCAEQHQYCNGEDNCTPPSGFYAYDLSKPPAIGYNALQLATYRLVFQYASFMQLDLILQFLRNEILLATQFVYGALGISSPLPATQWQLEIENLHNVSLAGMQSHGIIHASPANTEIKPGVRIHDIVVDETSTEDKKLCHNQKFRSSQYASFNLLGLVLLILLSFFIIALNLTLPSAVGWWQNKSGKGRTLRQAWIEDDVLHLQRMAFEGRGVGPWVVDAEDVPVLETVGMEFRRRRYSEGGMGVELERRNGKGDGEGVAYVGLREEVPLDNRW